MAMDQHLERVYLRYLRDECRYYVNAIYRLNLILQSQGSDVEGIFLHLRSAVSHAASVSRVLWPGQAKKASRASTRGQHLRRILEIEDTHVVRRRNLRDHIEHFDERLDDWAESSPHRNLVDRLVGPRSAIGGDAITDQDILNHFDPALASYIFRGEAFDIQELTNGVLDILRRVEVYLCPTSSPPGITAGSNSHAPPPPTSPASPRSPPPDHAPSDMSSP